MDLLDNCSHFGQKIKIRSALHTYIILSKCIILITCCATKDTDSKFSKNKYKGRLHLEAKSMEEIGCKTFKVQNGLAQNMIFI